MKSKNQLLATMGIVKKDPPEEGRMNQKTCIVCSRNPEKSKIKVGDIVEITEIVNGNCGSLSVGLSGKIEEVKRKGNKLKKIRIASYLLRISRDIKVEKVCSCCGKKILPQPPKKKHQRIAMRGNSFLFADFSC